MDSTYGLNQCIVTITRNCNLRCEFCYAKKTGYNALEYVEYNRLKQVIDFCSDAKVKYVALTGGEPLLYPELVDLLLYIGSRTHKMISTIATNGILMDSYELCKRLLDCGLGYVDVSLKGKDSQEWLNVTGVDGVKRQLEAISNLASLNADFTCSMVITHNNVNTYCETVKNAYDSGARNFSFTFVIDNENFDIKDLQYLELNDPLLLVDTFLEQIDRLNQITKGEWWIEYSFPLCVYTEEQLSKLEGRLAAPCHVFYGYSLTLDAKLNVIPCSMFIDDLMGKFGLDFSSAAEFLRFKEQKSYVSTMASLGRLPSGDCTFCQYKEACLGGCPWFWKHCSFEAFKEFKKGKDSVRF